MAKQSAAELAQAKPGFGGKLKRVFTNMGKSLKRVFFDTIAELKKVTWPTRENLINYTLIVLLFMAVLAVVVFALDTGASMLVNMLTRLRV